ncbi:MAG: ribosome-associated translation inhibitor RaiA [Elusimicrobiota bacterium]
MKIHVTGRRISLTPAIRSYIEKKLPKAQKYFKQIVWAQVMIAVEKRAHQCEIVIHASKQTFRAMAKSANLYAAIDLASDKIDTQLRKYKERLKDRDKWLPSPEDIVPDEPELSAVRFSVVKQLSMTPMSPERAAQEMETMGYNFWMFKNDKSRQVNVLFRRLDDSFGLLEPEKKGSR